MNNSPSLTYHSTTVIMSSVDSEQYNSILYHINIVSYYIFNVEDISAARKYICYHH